MESKKDLRFIFLFIVIVSISLLYLKQASFAKYRRGINGNIESTIAKWNIKVNDELIKNKSVLTNNIIPTIDSNPYTKDGVLAPGGTGYFDIIINASNVDVDFSYHIIFKTDENTPLDDLNIKTYTINNTSYNYNYETGITGDITKNTENTIIRVSFEWNDTGTNTMNNQDDTEYATNNDNPNAIIITTINFQQKQK